MRLVYELTGKEVKEGDVVIVDAMAWIIDSTPRPHKPASEGRVYLIAPEAEHERDYPDVHRSYYVSVIGAEWIEREDRE